MLFRVKEPAMGPTNEKLVELARQTQLQNYRPGPFVLTRGEGCRVWDVDDQPYLDLSAGIAVLALGHAHPRLVQAIREQAGRLIHVSNLFYNDRAIELSAAITARTPFDRVYFCNSGTEANEALIKLARRYHYEQGNVNRTKLVATVGSFHGRSMGALSLTGQPKYHEGMRPLLPDVELVAFNDLDAMDAALDERAAGVLVEPIQAEGGIIEGTLAYLQGLRKLCDERGVLLMFDEVQTGYGRTGTFLAQEWAGVVPDACSLAKGIGGGFPLGAAAMVQRVAGGLPPGSHASTFGGNALACAAGLAVLRVIDEEGLIDNVNRQGAYLHARLTDLARTSEAVVETRGRGLLQGLALADDIDPLATYESIRAQRVLTSLAGGTVLRISPALTVTEAELEEGLRVIEKVLKNAPRKDQGNKP